MPYADPEKRREAQRRYQQKYYEENAAYYKRKAKEGKLRIRKWFKEYKATLKCSQCPEDHPACLDFHHRDGDKEHMVAKMPFEGYSKKSILREVAKCVVLCSNCHRKLHNK